MDGWMDGWMDRWMWVSRWVGTLSPRINVHALVFEDRTWHQICDIHPRPVP